MATTKPKSKPQQQQPKSIDEEIQSLLDIKQVWKEYNSTFAYEEDLTKNPLIQHASDLYNKDKSFSPRFHLIAQTLIKHIISPYSMIRGYLITGKPGSGKTTQALDIANKHLKKTLTMDFLVAYRDKRMAKKKPIWMLTFDEGIFHREMNIYNPESILLPLLDAEKQQREEMKQLFESNIEMLGYRKFTNMLFESKDKSVSSVFLDDIKVSYFTPELYKSIERGDIGVNEELMKRLEDCLIIADEVHVIGKHGYLNKNGLALDYVVRFGKNIRVVLISASLISSDPREIVPYINILTGYELNTDDYFTKMANDVYVMRDSLKPYLSEIAPQVFILNTPSSLLYPRYVINGEKLGKGYPVLNFIPCEFTKIQQAYANDTLMQDIALISGREVYGRTLAANNIKTNQLLSTFKLEDLTQASGKLKWLVGFLNDNLLKDGNILIYTSTIIYPGLVLLRAVLELVGLIHYNDRNSPKANTLCLACMKKLSQHGKSHTFKPMCYIDLDRTLLSDEDWAKYFALLTSPENFDGSICKVSLGTPAINVGISFTHHNKLVIYDLPFSIPMYVQLVGRLVRPRIVSKLQDKIVQIYTLCNIHPDGDETNDLKTLARHHHNWIETSRMMGIIGKDSIFIQQLMKLIGPEEAIRSNIMVDPTPKPKYPHYSHTDMNKYLDYHIEYNDILLEEITTDENTPRSIESVDYRISVVMIVAKILLSIKHTIPLKDFPTLFQEVGKYLSFDLTSLSHDEITAGVLNMCRMCDAVDLPWVDFTRPDVKKGSMVKLKRGPSGAKIKRSKMEDVVDMPKELSEMTKLVAFNTMVRSPLPVIIRSDLRVFKITIDANDLVKIYDPEQNMEMNRLMQFICPYIINDDDPKKNTYNNVRMMEKEDKEVDLMLKNNDLKLAKATYHAYALIVNRDFVQILSALERLFTKDKYGIDDAWNKFTNIMNRMYEVGWILDEVDMKRLKRKGRIGLVLEDMLVGYDYNDITIYNWNVRHETGLSITATEGGTFVDMYLNKGDTIGNIDDVSGIDIKNYIHSEEQLGGLSKVLKKEDMKKKKTIELLVTHLGKLQETRFAAWRKKELKDMPKMRVLLDSSLLVLRELQEWE